MNIAPKYEDVVAKLDAALGRETALREELDQARETGKSYMEMSEVLQQRLTVAERRLSQVEGACDLAMSAIDDDERGANFVKIIQAIKNKAAIINLSADVKINGMELMGAFCTGDLMIFGWEKPNGNFVRGPAYDDFFGASEAEEKLAAEGEGS